MDGGSFRRFTRAGFLNVTFKELSTRIPAFFRSDDTVAGYQDRLLGELPDFRNFARSFARLEKFARDARFLEEARRRHQQRRLYELRTNRLDEILGLPPDFPPPPIGLFRITKLREWSARTIKRRTPIPFAEIRVYLYTRQRANPLWGDGSLLRAIEAVQRELDTFSDPRVRANAFQETLGREDEPVDEDELEEENRRQGRGFADRIKEEDLQYFVAFYKAVGSDPKGSVKQYYGKVNRVGGLWIAEAPRVAVSKPSFSTTEPIYRPPGS